MHSTSWTDLSSSRDWMTTPMAGFVNMSQPHQALTAHEAIMVRLFSRKLTGSYAQNSSRRRRYSSFGKGL